MTEGPGGLRRVRLADLPVQKMRELYRHVDDLVHEFGVIESGMTTGTVDVDVPRRLGELVRELNERYGHQRLVSRRLVEEAAARGDATVTIELDVPVDAAQTVTRYRELLDEADEYCRRGELLTLALPPELVAFRHQLFDLVIVQLR